MSSAYVNLMSQSAHIVQIYATSEERKQRNRQAQAAFRERRTEYIKQLETTIQHHEDTLQSLQQSHRQAADECLMLRYKNSLLERILLEKGAINRFRH
jgi:phage shock protein A